MKQGIPGLASIAAVQMRCQWSDSTPWNRTVSQISHGPESCVDRSHITHRIIEEQEMPTGTKHDNDPRAPSPTTRPLEALSEFSATALVQSI